MIKYISIELQALIIIYFLPAKVFDKSLWKIFILKKIW